MKLTQYSDLGMRLLMYLALNKGKSVTIQDVSDHFGVSKNHMVKISHQLTKCGLIESTRGRYGGVALAKPADTINIKQVLLATEENFDLVECFADKKNHCVISDACRLNKVLDEALQAFFTVLRNTTLADLVTNGPELEKVLSQFPIKAFSETRKKLKA
jgi:Rrf2 family nitric oxide-sensitive transcriptional repressor